MSGLFHYLIVPPDDESFTHLCLQKTEMSVVKTTVLKILRLRGFDSKDILEGIAR